MTTQRKPRYKLSFRVAYDDGNSFMTASVADISETGAFLETVMPLKVGTKVTMTPLVDDELGIHELDAKVVRVLEENLDVLDQVPGMGVTFISPDAAAVANLKKLFENNADKKV